MQRCGSVFIWYGSVSSILGWILIRINPGFWWPKIETNLQLKKITIYLSLGCHKGRLSYKRSLHLSKENIRHFKTWNSLNFILLFCGLLLPSWVRIRIPNTDPDPVTRLNPDLIRIRVRNPGHMVNFIELVWRWGARRTGGGGEGRRRDGPRLVPRQGTQGGHPTMRSGDPLLPGGSVVDRLIRIGILVLMHQNQFCRSGMFIPDPKTAKKRRGKKLSPYLFL